MSTAELTAALTDMIRERAADSKTPAITWAVSIHGSMIAHGRTSADGPVESAGGPSDHLRLVHRIASMTKSFTAATVLSLRDEGVLALDDPIAELAPELSAIRHPSPDAPAITVRHLLSMASGLATDDAWADRHLDISHDALTVLYNSGATFAAIPETLFEYSNLGYSMLGRIIWRVTGLRPQQAVNERLLRPLGLVDTGWTQPTHDHWARPHRLVGDDLTLDDEPLGDGGIAPMGGLWSSVADVTKWATWLGNAFPAGRGDGDSRVLKPASRREMQRAHMWTGFEDVVSPDGTTRTFAGGYGFGLLVDQDPRHGTVVSHTGGLPGYGSNMRWVPDRGVVIVALGNVTYAPMEPLTTRLLDRLADLGALPSPAPEAVASPALRHAADELVGLLSVWDDDRARVLFADNVVADESFARRRVTAEAHLGSGPIRITRLDAERATRGTIHAERTDGTAVEIGVELSPHVSPLVQWYKFLDPPT